MELDLAYNLLKLSHNSSLKEVIRAFRREAQLTHPDRFVNTSEGERMLAEERFKLINEAYHTILDEGNLSSNVRFGRIQFFRKREFSEEEKKQREASVFGEFASSESTRLRKRLENRGRGILTFVAIGGFIVIIMMNGFVPSLVFLVVLVIFSSLVIWLHRYFGE